MTTGETVPGRRSTIAETALVLIRAHGPLTIDELAPLVVAAGRTKAKDPRRAVASAIGGYEFLEGRDGRLYSTAIQLDGATFTVAPTDLEVRGEFVIVRDDLSLVRRLLTPRRWSATEDRAHLHFFNDHLGLPSWDEDVIDVDDDGRLIRDADWTFLDHVPDRQAADLLGFLEDIGLPPGADEETALRELSREMELTDVIHGPPGWMPELGSRQVLALRIAGGVVTAAAIDRRETRGVHLDAAADRIARLARQLIGPDPSWFGPPAIPIELLLEVVAAEAPELLRRPLPPLNIVIERGGLEVEDGWVGHPDTNWDLVHFRDASGDAAAWGFDPPDGVQ
jgi:hypothetical protein